MEEPTVGLDLVLRTSLWNVIKHAKQDRTIILTSNLSLYLGLHHFELHSYIYNM